MRNIFWFVVVFGVVLTAPFTAWRVMFGNIPLCISELLIICLAGYVLLVQRVSLKSPPRFVWVAALLMLLGVGTSLLANGITAHGLGILKSWFLFPMLFAWLLWQWADTREKREGILLAWFAALTLVAVVALGYWWQGILTYDERLRAFFLSPNALAMYLAPGAFLGLFLGMGFWQMKQKSKVWGVGICWLLMLLVFYKTYSYTTWISVFAGGFVYWWLVCSLGQRVFWQVVCVCVGLILVLGCTQINHSKIASWFDGSERSSLDSRMMIWRASWRMLQEHPVVGIGPGNFQTTYLAYQKYFPPYLEWAVPEPHNLYMAFWLQSGLLGLLGFIGLVAGGLKTLWRTKQKYPLEASMFLAIMSSILVQGLFDTPYWKADLAYQFWLVVAVGLAIQDPSDTAGRRDGSRKRERFLGDVSAVLPHQ